MIYPNLTHALPGQRPMALVTFSTNGKLPLKLSSVFLYFYSHKIVGINFPRNACHYFCMWYCWVLWHLYIRAYIVTPQKTFLLKHHCENSELCICIFSYKKLFIWIQEYLLKRLNVLISSNVILFILTDKLNLYNLSTFPNVSTLSPMK